MSLPRWITPRTVLRLMDEAPELHATKRAEARDALYGRVFCMAALVRSGRLWSGEPDADLLAAQNGSATVDAGGALERVVRELLDLSSHKAHIGELCASVLCDCVRSGPVDLIQTTVAPLLHQRLQAPLESWTADTLAVALALYARTGRNRLLFSAW